MHLAAGLVLEPQTTYEGWQHSGAGEKEIASFIGGWSPYLIVICKAGSMDGCMSPGARAREPVLGAVL